MLSNCDRGSLCNDVVSCRFAIFDDHMRGVMSLNDWTTYKVERVGDYEFRLEVEV